MLNVQYISPCDCLQILNTDIIYFVNILLVTETYLPYITGVSVSTDSIAKYMISQGHKVTIVCPKQIAKGELQPLNNLKVITVPSIPFTTYNQNTFAIPPFGFLTINNLMKKEKFDVVHIQEPGITGVSALIAAKMNHIPVIGALHFIPEQVDRVIWGRFEKVLTPLFNIYIKIIYNQYNAIMTPSHFFADFLKRLKIRKPIHVISNGVDTIKFSPTAKNPEARRKLGIPEKSVLFFYLGRIDGDKNVETLVKAMPYTSPEVMLLIVGKGKKLGQMKKLSEKIGVNQKISWINFIKDSEIVDFYHKADVFSIMSPYEGQSIVTLQAVAVGLPILAADAGALPELCHDTKNGFLVGTYDFKSLAIKMNLLAKDKKLRKEFGAESRRISLAHHKPKVLHSLEMLYTKLSQ